MRVTSKISAETVGRAKCLVTVCAHLAGLKESITVNVVVPREAEEKDVHEAAVARAKDLARSFAFG
jgi:hypothetical protein